MCKPSRNEHPQQGEAGFSLLESLIALTILSVALVVLLQAQSGGARTVDTAAKYGNARIIASSLLAETLSRLSVGAPVNTDGRNGEFSWQITIAKSANKFVKAPPPRQARDAWRLHKVRVTVSWDKSQELTLQTLKLLRN